MIRKVIGWALAIISAMLLLLTMVVGVYGFSSSKIELAATVFQSGIVSFFVCAGLSILFLKKRQSNNDNTTKGYKVKKIFGYLFLIMFIFSIPGLHHFDMYEMLPRALILIIAYFLLKPNRAKQLSHNQENVFNNMSVIQTKEIPIKEYKSIQEWQLKTERNFTQEEIDAVSRAVVRASSYGKTVEFLMKLGGRPCHIPLDNSSNIEIGEAFDMAQAKILTLEKEGECDIVRVKV